MRFGDRLRALREEKGITQKELGRYINISDRVIGYYESNNRFPKDEEILKRLADYFNISMDDLLGYSSVRTRQEPKTKKKDCALDVSGLPDEAARQLEEYIVFLKQKYNVREFKKG